MMLEKGFTAMESQIWTASDVEKIFQNQVDYFGANGVFSFTPAQWKQAYLRAIKPRYSD
jgi:hypothetical protein